MTTALGIRQLVRTPLWVLVTIGVVQISYAQVTEDLKAWNGIAWGATMPEVLRTLKGATRKGETVVTTVKIVGRDFDAEMHFRDAGFAGVIVRLSNIPGDPSPIGREVFEGLVGKYGKPSSGESAAPLHMGIYQWRRPSGDIRLFWGGKEDNQTVFIWYEKVAGTPVS